MRRSPTAILATLACAVLAGACSSGHAASRAKTTTTAPHSSTSSSSTTTTTVPAAAEWTTYGGSTARTSADTTEAPFTAAPTAAWTSPQLDGAVYGEPLIFEGQVLVATENDTVYALSAANGSIEWSDHLGTPVPSSALPCGDITPTSGITSTMVVDPSAKVLFVSAATWNGASVGHWLFAVDLANHEVAWGHDLDQPGWVSADQQQRAGLALDGGLVLVGFGGNYGDCGDYHGWVIGAPEIGSGPLSVYQVPTANEGAIWAPAGPAVDPSGDVFVATGNGSARPGQGFDHGDAVIELSTTLSELQYWAPSNWAELNVEDLDLGSTTPVLLGGGRLFEVGKGGTGYLLNAASLGGVGGPAPSISLCNSRGATAYDAATSLLYVVCTDAGTIDEVGVGAGGLARGWTWSSPTGEASSPTLARGALWVVDIGASVLYGIDPSTGTTRWSLPLGVGTPPHFAGVSAGEGLLVVGGSKAVEAFR
jgi:outer membrane protein assembly factor BamB